MREAPSVVHESPPAALVVGTLAAIVAWVCAILLFALMTSLRHRTIIPVAASGFLALALQLWLAWAHACGWVAYATGIATHCATLFMLCVCWAASSTKTNDVMAAESKRDKRERELISLLVDRVQSRCTDLVDSSRWIAMVDICMSCAVFGTFVFVAVKAWRDIIFDTALMKIVQKIFGISMSSVLWYTLIAFMVVMLAPLLAHFFLRIRDGMQRLSVSPSQRHAKAMRRLAVETAEWAAARERETLSQAIVGSDSSVVLKCVRAGGREDNTSEHSSLAPPQGSHVVSSMHFTGDEFKLWVETQAKQVLEYRLGADWHVHEKFILEEEAQCSLLAGGLHRAADATAQNVFAAQRHASRTCLGAFARWSWWPCIGCAVLCGVVAVVTWHSGSDAARSRPPAATAPSGANASCGGGALKWGGALAAGAAVLFAVPGVGPAGLAAVELASAAGIGAGGGFTQLISCYMG